MSGTETVQAGCSLGSKPAARIIFIEKRRSFPASQKMQLHFWSLSRTCNVFLTKMDALLPDTRLMSSLPELSPSKLVPSVSLTQEGVQYNNQQFEFSFRVLNAGT